MGKRSFLHGGEARLCYSISCGNRVKGKRKHCDPCKKRRDVQLADPSTHPEIITETIRERMVGDGPYLRLIRKYGARKCLVCSVTNSLPGRLYCCPACRARAHSGEIPTVEVDGVVATHIEHARTRGISMSTLAKRLMRMDLIEALTTPINQRYSTTKKGVRDGDDDGASTKVDV